ncbi:calcium-binding protein [Shimia abyssi]|nr:calcium-binding protein [Shimia abyssi]
MAAASDKLDAALVFASSDIGDGDPKIEALKQRIADHVARIESRTEDAGDFIKPAATLAKPIATAIDAATALLSSSTVLATIQSFAIALNGVVSAFNYAIGPINSVVSKAKPVIDALDSIFGWLLSPLEGALEWIVEKTGIGDVIDSLVSKVTDLLPNTDFLEPIVAQFTTQLTNLENYVSLDIVAQLERLVVQLGSDALEATLRGTSDSEGEVYLGTLAKPGPETATTKGGNDILLGGIYDDTLNGGAGDDFFIGGGGDDLIIGGAGRDVVLFNGKIEDFGLLSRLTPEGFASGTWVIADYSDLGPSNNGTDTLEGVETLIFDDMVVDIDEIDTFIQTRSEDGDITLVTQEFSNVFVDGEPVLTSNGVDWTFGGAGFDQFLTGPGNDRLASSDNGLASEYFGFPGDRLDGGAGNDTFLVSRNGTFDIVLGGDGEDAVNFNDMPRAVSVFLAHGLSGALYRPTDVEIDMDPYGQYVPQGSIFFGPTASEYVSEFPFSMIQDVERINGSDYGDIFWGDDQANLINGRDGDDSIRGLGGDDLLLGGNGNDWLIGDRGNDTLMGGNGSNYYVGGLGDDFIEDTSSFGSTVFYGPEHDGIRYAYDIDFPEFKTTGYVNERLDLPDGIVILGELSPGVQQVSKYASGIVAGDRIGVDTIKGIDEIVGSAGADIIQAADSLHQLILAGAGDDDLRGSTAGNSAALFGGQGNDHFSSQTIAADMLVGEVGDDTFFYRGDTRIEGDKIYGDIAGLETVIGFNTLDMSESGLSLQLFFDIDTGFGNGWTLDTLGRSGGTADRFIPATAGIYGATDSVVPDGLSAPQTQDGALFGAATLFRIDLIKGSAQRDIVTVGTPGRAMEVQGYDGDDVLFGSQLASDILNGGAGDDVLGTINQNSYSNFDLETVTTLAGGSGNDLFVAGDAREVFIGGPDIDELTYEASDAAVQVSLATGVGTGGFAEADQIYQVEILTGSAFGDLLVGDDLGNLLLGWLGDDTINGGGDADLLFGDAGHDLLQGGLGNDALHGGDGNDTLDGGEGVDTASFNLYQITPKNLADGIVTEAGGIVADLTTGIAGSDTLIDIENLEGTNADDTLRGDEFDNALAGDGGDDLLEGNGGDDVLLGGDGNDTLRGGSGDDWFSGGGGSNLHSGDDGDDTLDFAGRDYGITVVMAGVGSRQGLDTGIVNSLVEVDFPVWTDSLSTEIGPSGDPEDLIATGTDEIRFTTRTLDRGTPDPSDDLVENVAEITPERIFRLNPEYARGPADLLPVDGLPDFVLRTAEQAITVVGRYVGTIDLFDGIETIVGGLGDDDFLGNSEDTTFHGGIGEDTIRGGAGSDTSSYLASEAAVTINLGTGVIEGGDATGDVLESIENITGSEWDDSLTGDEGANWLKGDKGSDTLIGGAGDDTLQGGEGLDSHVGGAGRDTVIFDYSSENYTARRIEGGGLRIFEIDGAERLGEDIIAGDIEVVQFTDRTFEIADLPVLDGTAYDDVLNGTDVGDVVMGREGSDRMSGNGGADLLYGDEGDDVINGGANNDTLIGGAGRDRMAGGDGDDLYQVDNLNDWIVEFEDSGDDTVESSVDHTLDPEVETLRFVGDIGRTGLGNDGANRIEGTAANDHLDGAGGNDTLEGGGGNDLLTGGAGADTFVFAAGNGNDTINDFSFAEMDQLNVLGLGLTSEAEVLGSMADTVNGALLSANGTTILFDGQLVAEFTSSTGWFDETIL